MRLHRFYIDKDINIGGVNTIPDESLAHQLRSVFRFHKDSELILFNGSGIDYVAQIVSIDKKHFSFRVSETVEVKRFSNVNICLAMSLIKKDKFEWVLEKCTELGVFEFVPILSERSEKKGLNMDRAKRILIEASEQCGRGDIPKINEPILLEDFLNEKLNSTKDIFVFDMSGIKIDQKIKENILSKKDAVIFVGPEGGWSQKEIAFFKERNATLIRIDTPVLRAETAAVSASSIILC